jgi:hypothetical protein
MFGNPRTAKSRLKWLMEILYHSQTVRRMLGKTSSELLRAIGHLHKGH